MRRKNVTGNFVIFNNSEVILSRKIAESENCQVYLTDKNSLVKYYTLDSPEILDYFYREIPIYQIMSPHPNLAGYLNHSVTGNQGYLHLEFYRKGDFNYVMATKKLQLSEIRESVLDICTALADLHGKGITHLDLRPENVVLSNEGITKLCDFGSSLRPDLQVSLRNKGKLEEFVEKNLPIVCRPPEFFSESPLNIGPWTDMWQVGCLIYTMVYYKPPFPHGFAGHVDLNTAPKLFKGILASLLDQNCDKRMTAQQVIENLIPNFLLSGRLSEKRVGFVERIVSRSTKQLLNKILSNDEGLHLHEISRLVYKASKNPIKITKFLDSITEKLNDNVLQSLKILAVVHLYSFKVAIIFDQAYEKLKLITHSLIINWNIKSAERPVHPYSKYFAGFIKQYSHLFELKLKLLKDFQINFNWSNTFIGNDSIESVIDYLEFCLFLLQGLSFPLVQDFFQFRQEISKILINEISIVVLIFAKVFKQNIDFANHRYLRFKKLHRQVKTLCDKYCYSIFLAALPDESSLSQFKSYATSREEQYLTGTL